MISTYSTPMVAALEFDRDFQRYLETGEHPL